MRNFGRWIGLSFLIVLLDQYTKWLAAAKLTVNTPVVINQFFNLNLDYNKGMAFSLLSQGAIWQRLILAGFSAFVSIIIFVLLKNSDEQKTVSRLGLSFILGGAVGNFIDRAFAGEVTDFIQWHIGTYYWPTFNIADSAVCIGAAFFIWGMRGEADDKG